MDRRLIGLKTAFVSLLVASLLLAPTVAAKPRDGDTVVLSGRVVDQEGKPVPRITVLLEASNRSFSLRHFEKRTGEVLKLPKKTDAQGNFQFDWKWDRDYNLFALAVGLEVTRTGEPGFELLETRDITAEMSSGSPEPLRIELDNLGWLRWIEVFMAGNASDAERNLYRELGRPQKLTTEGSSSAWWYFELGKVYRFEGGKLDQVIHFDPVTPR